jgi:predicted transcriptional regulator YdeE
MNARIEQRPEMFVVGVVSTGRDVRQIKIHDLWEEFDQVKDMIMHQVPGKNYELHIDDLVAEKHYCVAGVEVERIENLPVHMFAKQIPASTYIVFTHEFKDGGFGEAYRLMSEWLIKNEYVQAFPLELQCYDDRFLGIEHNDSVIEFMIPVCANPKYT